MQLFEGRGLKVESVPVDDEGLRVDALEALLEHTQPAFVYTIPAFQNPSGVTMSPARREGLLALAARHDFLVVADEVYQLLSYGAPPPPPMRRFGGDRVLSLGSFSKILAPGLRLGWIEGRPDLLARLAKDGVLQSGGGVSPWTQAVLRPLLDDGGLAEIIEHFRAAYRTRAEALDEALRAALGPQARMRKPEGGYFIWLELPEGVEAQALLPVAQKHGVRFLPGPACAADGGHERFLRACFALYAPDVLAEGARRLGRAVEEAAGS